MAFKSEREIAFFQLRGLKIKRLLAFFRENAALQPTISNGFAPLRRIQPFSRNFFVIFYNSPRDSFPQIRSYGCAMVRTQMGFEFDYKDVLLT